MEVEEVKASSIHGLSDQVATEVAKVEPSYGGDLWDSISILE
jgi:hypothetical protein